MENGLPTQRDVPLTSEDLNVCNVVLDRLVRKLDIATDKENVASLAAIIIELFRQGVHDPEQLQLLAGAARGQI